MIRINLLPQKKRRAETRAGGDTWVLIALGVLVFEFVLLFVFHGFKERELEAEQQKNAAVRSQIATSQNVVKNHAAVLKELERLRSREDAISRLQSARTGPTAVLLEIAKILTPGRGPTVDPETLAQIRRDNPLAVSSPNWDTRRLWMTEFHEENRLMKLSGVARDATDVSELAKRMNLSAFFGNVRLLPARRTADDKSGLELVTFALEAEVKY
jgi:type IV pilus assembly protein PilN